MSSGVQLQLNVALSDGLAVANASTSWINLQVQADVFLTRLRPLL